MERWLFLEKESREKIENLAYALNEAFENQWDFSQFVQHKTARQPMEKSYSLKDCFMQGGKLRDQKLVVGQVFLRKPMIRMAFLNQDIWADFMVEDTPKNYVRADSLFLPIFGYKLEDYPHQQQI